MKLGYVFAGTWDHFNGVLHVLHSLHAYPSYSCYAKVRQKHYRGNEYTRNIKKMLDACIMGLCVYPPNFARHKLGKYVTAAMKNCWKRRFLCGPSSIKSRRLVLPRTSCLKIIISISWLQRCCYFLSPSELHYNNVVYIKLLRHIFMSGNKLTRAQNEKQRTLRPTIKLQTKLEEYSINPFTTSIIFSAYWIITKICLIICVRY
jgi:hypothetical protein